MINTLWCLHCDAEITEGNNTSEHVIPNALGGRLKTTSAICRNCNSRLGADIESEFIKKLSFLTNVLDVERDRGGNPDLIVEDSNTGLKLRQRPGKLAELDKNIRHQKTEDGEATISFFAKTESLAKGVLRRFPKANVESLHWEPVENFQYEFKRALPGYLHPTDLRVPAKIMLNYARLMGLSVARESSLVNFVRGCELVSLPIAAPRANVVRAKGEGCNCCAHTLMVWAPKAGNFALCYLDLFSCLDYVGIIELDAAPPFEACAYRYDVIEAAFVETELSWDAEVPAVLNWIAEPRIPYDRMLQRGQVIQYWLSHREEMWIRRGLRKGCSAFDKILRKRGTLGDAEEVFISTLSNYLACRGLDVSRCELKFKDL
jgi:hypothetical protein